MEKYGITNDNEFCYTCEVTEEDETNFMFKKAESAAFLDTGEVLLTGKDTGNEFYIGEEKYEYHELCELYSFLKVVFKRKDGNMAGEISVYKKQ